MVATTESTVVEETPTVTKKTRNTASKASKASKSSTRFTPKEWDPYSEPKQRLQISLDASLTEYNSKVQNLEQEVRQFLRNISKSSPKINQEMADILMLEIKNLDIGKITCISGLDKRHGRDEIPYNKKGERVYQASFRALAEQVQDKLNIRMVSLKKTPTSARGILNRFNTSTNKLKELKSQIFEYTTEGQEVARQRTREQDRKDDARSGQEPTFLQRFLG